MSLPDDILLEEIWHYLPAATLLKYCGLNTTLNSICSKNETWQHLIDRDFKIIYDGEDAKDEYRRLYRFTEINLDDPMIAQFANYLKKGGSYQEYISHMLVPVSNYYFNTKYILDNLRHFIYVRDHRNDIIRQLIAYFREAYDTPKSYRHEYSDYELTKVPLEKIIGNS